MTQCPCGSGDPFDICCGVHLSGSRPAPTAEALMHSRYTAFFRGDWGYLDQTHAPETRPAEKDAAEAEAVEWLGLEVLSADAGGEDDCEGSVEFVARYRLGETEGRLHEISRFVRRDGAWLYLDGAFPDSARPAAKAPKAGRNDPCPCGSGKKYKKCCG